MGNAPSAARPSPWCKVLCLCPGPVSGPDEDEWFGNLPRKSKRRQSQRRRSRLPAMSVVPEQDDERSELSYLDDAMDSSEQSPRKKQPRDKLTFVNGQFVDVSTEKGQALVRAATSEGTGGGIGGILTSLESGHCGIMGSSAGEDSRKHSSHWESLRRQSLSRKDSGKGGEGRQNVSRRESIKRKFRRGPSFEGSLSSSSLDVDEPTSLFVVSSIVPLGGGHFLTSSKSDQVIKMWRGDDDGSISFVRNFAGHRTGVACLAKVDEKGRFLSASKDKEVKLWDSRFNCDDEDDSERTLLATFANVDRLSAIAVVDDGSYVRPTDQVDMAMVKAVAKMTVKKGSSAVQQAAKQRQVIGCTCQFATITGRHKQVKIWSVKETEQQCQLPLEGGNVARATMEQELEHDAVVESVASARMTGMLLSGDRTGTVRLWSSENQQFTCVRTFSWRQKSELSTIKQSMQLAITSLSFLQGNTMFACGSKGGDLRVWKVEGTKQVGETAKKEVAVITGAHSSSIVAVRRGPRAEENSDDLFFSSAEEDGNVLSFAISRAETGRCQPSCLNVVDHNIADRYVPDPDPVCVSTLACIDFSGKDKLITGTNDGRIHLLSPPESVPGHDALLGYRRDTEEESLTLRAIAEEACSAGGVATHDRKHTARTYKNVFLGRDFVSHLVDRKHALSRKDALDLARILAAKFSLFQCVTKKDKLLEDDGKSFYRWSDEFSHVSPNRDC